MSYTDVDFRDIAGGVRTEIGTVLPPGGRVFYVHHSGGRSTDPAEIQTRTQDNLNDALGECTSGNGDIVYLLPGHAENINIANYASKLKAGTKIIGLGWGNLRPTLTWNAAGATFAIDKSNVSFENIIFNCAGSRSSTTALTVTAAFPCTASGITFERCSFSCAVDTDQLCTSMITLSAACDDFTFKQNEVFGGATGTVTDVIISAGAVDNIKLIGNVIRACATTQLIDLSDTACVDTVIIGNVIENKLANTTMCVKVSATGLGIVHNNIWITKATGTAPASSGFTTTTTMFFGLNYCSTVLDKSAIICPGVDS